MLTERGRIDSWPMTGPAFGMTVRFFEPVGNFVVRQEGPVWIVRDKRVANSRGGPDAGIEFTSLEEVEEYIKARVGQDLINHPEVKFFSELNQDRLSVAKINKKPV